MVFKARTGGGVHLPDGLGHGYPYETVNETTWDEVCAIRFFRLLCAGHAAGDAEKFRDCVRVSTGTTGQVGAYPAQSSVCHVWVRGIG